MSLQVLHRLCLPSVLFCLCIRRPVALVYVILATLPCFAFLIASSEV